jgi:hypothetical protein
MRENVTGQQVAQILDSYMMMMMMMMIMTMTMSNKRVYREN